MPQVESAPGKNIANGSVVAPVSVLQKTSSIERAFATNTTITYVQIEPGASPPAKPTRS